MRFHDASSHELLHWALHLAWLTIVVGTTCVEATRLQGLPSRDQNLAFDVASVKANTTDATPGSRFPLGNGDAYAPGGLFAATNQPLIAYVQFAFKTTELRGVPSWVHAERFDIEARASGSPTKEQMRVMMRALLAERFKLTTHVERRTRPVFTLVQVRKGRTGPQLRSNSNGSQCSAMSSSGARTEPRAPRSASAPEVLDPPSVPCGNIGPVLSGTPGYGRLVGRDVTLARIASVLANPATDIDRPVLDGTGLRGTFDFSLEWSLAPELSQVPGAQSPIDGGPTFLRSLRDQLGLKLIPTRSPVDEIVVDSIERPTEN